MSLRHCLHPALISAPLCDTQAAFDNGFGGRGCGKTPNRARLEGSVSLQGGDTDVVGCHSEGTRFIQTKGGRGVEVAQE